MIRFFALCSHEGEISELGIRFCDALVATGMQVRVIAIEPAEIWDAVAERRDKRTGQILVNAAPAARWARHRALFATPIVGPYINCVCAPTYYWNRFYTVGVRNVLITSAPPERVGTLYQQIIVPTAEIASAWLEHVSAERVTVVPIDLADRIAEMTMAILGGLPMSPSEHPLP